MNPLLTHQEQAHLNTVRSYQHFAPDTHPARYRSAEFAATVLRLLWQVAPLLISGWLLYALMDGVSGNWTAQWLLALCAAGPLSGWVIHSLRRWM